LHIHTDRDRGAGDSHTHGHPPMRGEEGRQSDARERKGGTFHGDVSVERAETVSRHCVCTIPKHLGALGSFSLNWSPSTYMCDHPVIAVGGP